MAVVVLGLLVPLSLAACTAEKPDTYFDWGLQDSPGQAAVVSETDVKPIARPGTRKHYVYRDQKTAADDVQPQARPAPGWYRDTHPSYRDNNCANPQPRTAAVAATTATKNDTGGSPRFVWPLRGQVIDDFGATKNGERNDGINIAATYETPIRASASGKVSYVGNDLKSYGNLVLIRHDGDYVTAYAHAERLTVRKGDYVQAGQIIGYSGASGDVSRPQLHFEIRRGTTPVNPHNLLAG
jgi:murein DD-endopeptidase MepM/ murein hydrolase activator NlpD